MSGNYNEFKLSPDDAYKFLTCESHIGTSTSDFQTEQYVFKRREDGTHLINIGFTWEKLLLAARAIVAIKDPADVCVVSGRPQAQRALLKFAAHTGASSIVGRFVPGSFTNQIQKHFKEPRLIIVSDPRLDHQAVKESSCVNIPVIAFTDTDSPLKFVDIAIPCNNKGPHSVGLMWWMLAREVLRLRGKIALAEQHTQETYDLGLDLTSFFTLDGKQIMPDLYFFRDPEQQKKEEEGEGTEAGPAEVKDTPIIIDDVADGAAEKEIQFDYNRIQDWADPLQNQQPTGEHQQTEQPPNDFSAPKGDGDDW